jgi:CspA family cold shock protein
VVQGTVRFSNQRGSYGFLNTEDSEDTDEDEVFFHMADIRGPDLAEGQHAEFEIKQSDKGPRAANLTRLDEDGNRWVSINDM